MTGTRRRRRESAGRGPGALVRNAAIDEPLEAVEFFGCAAVIPDVEEVALVLLQALHPAAVVTAWFQTSAAEPWQSMHSAAVRRTDSDVVARAARSTGGTASLCGRTVPARLDQTAAGSPRKRLQVGCPLWQNILPARHTRSHPLTPASRMLIHTYEQYTLSAQKSCSRFDFSAATHPWISRHCMMLELEFYDPAVHSKQRCAGKGQLLYQAGIPQLADTAHGQQICTRPRATVLNRGNERRGALCCRRAYRACVHCACCAHRRRRDRAARARHGGEICHRRRGRRS